MKTPPGWDRSHLGDKGPRPVNLKLLSPHGPTLRLMRNLNLEINMRIFRKWEMSETISGPGTWKV